MILVVMTLFPIKLFCLFLTASAALHNEKQHQNRGNGIIEADSGSAVTKVTKVTLFLK